YTCLDTDTVVIDKNQEYVVEFVDYYRVRHEFTYRINGIIPYPDYEDTFDIVEDDDQISITFSNIRDTMEIPLRLDVAIDTGDYLDYRTTRTEWTISEDISETVGQFGIKIDPTEDEDIASIVEKAVQTNIIGSGYSNVSVKDYDLPSAEELEVEPGRAKTLKIHYTGDQEDVSDIAITLVGVVKIVDEATDDYFVMDQDESATIKCTGVLDALKEVYMDDEIVDPSNYTLESGSTIINFKKEYLESLSEGRHAVKLQYEATSCETSLNILSEEPTTGTIERLAGAGRIDTSIKAADALKEIYGVDKFDTIVMANAWNFPDALTGSYLAACYGAPMLLTDGGDPAASINYVKENLSEGGQVYILGGNAAVPEIVAARLEGYNGMEVKRLAGASRYETNLMILEAAGCDEYNTLLIASGSTAADSLSASSTG
ncbi:MAG: cell wall-binding repeat-containing protein, partial [Lachnospiraceae bacterium]|nr:cell wall-binding repeat-containing protein [Candidatus Equihabitans merdae]